MSAPETKIDKRTLPWTEEQRRKKSELMKKQWDSGKRKRNGGQWKSEAARQRSINAMTMANIAGGKYRGKLTIPTKAHPLVRHLFKIMNQQMATLSEVAEEAGTTRHVISQWRTQNLPRLDTLIAAFNSLGWDLCAVKQGSSGSDIGIDVEHYPSGLTGKHRKIYDILKSAGSKYVSDREISEITGSSTNSVKVFISQMKKKGVQIENKWGVGYRLPKPVLAVVPTPEPKAVAAPMPENEKSKRAA